MPSLTLFGIPKPFSGHIGVIQRNAIRSWKLLRPKVEIILFGDDRGTKDFADQLGVQHVANIEKTDQGTPLLSDIFQQAHQLVKTDLLGYVNADILLLDDFPSALEKVTKCIPDDFLAIGRRINTDIVEELDFETPDWREKVRLRTKAAGDWPHEYAKIFLCFPSTSIMICRPSPLVERTGTIGWFTAHISSKFLSSMSRR